MPTAFSKTICLLNLTIRLRDYVTSKVINGHFYDQKPTLSKTSSSSDLTLSKLYMNANNIKTQTFHKISYDLKCH